MTTNGRSHEIIFIEEIAAKDPCQDHRFDAEKKIVSQNGIPIETFFMRAHWKFIEMKLSNEKETAKECVNETLAPTTNFTSTGPTLKTSKK